MKGPKKTAITSFESYFGKNRIDWILSTFPSNNGCDFLEQAIPNDFNQDIKEYTYADEYLYGGDDEDALFEERKD